VVSFVCGSGGIEDNLEPVSLTDTIIYSIAVNTSGRIMMTTLPDGLGTTYQLYNGTSVSEVEITDFTQSDQWALCLWENDDFLLAGNLDGGAYDDDPGFSVVNGSGTVIDQTNWSTEDFQELLFGSNLAHGYSDVGGYWMDTIVLPQVT
jgi:hypothetical protein